MLNRTKLQQLAEQHGMDCENDDESVWLLVPIAFSSESERIECKTVQDMRIALGY